MKVKPQETEVIRIEIDDSISEMAMFKAMEQLKVDLEQRLLVAHLWRGDSG